MFKKWNFIRWKRETRENVMPPSSTDIFAEKSVYFGNANDEVLPLSVEEVLSKKLNDLRGWKCAIGIENLHISPDGNIYGGACRNSGFLGNVFEKAYYLNKSWHTCTRKMCSCGADMQVRKVKEDKYIQKTYKDMPTNRIVQSITKPVYMAPVHQEMHRRHPLTLTWDLGRRCNYSCSYCNPNIANNYEAHRSWGSLMYAWEGLEKHFLKNRIAKFVFTGGEPTINPAYFDFVKFITDKGHYVHTTTNGARLPDYYGELLKLSVLGFSYHLEFAKLEHYQKIMSTLIDLKKSHEKAKYNWCGVRIMVPPGKAQEAQFVREGLISLEGFAESGIHIMMSPCYDSKTHTSLMEYEAEELRLITTYA